MCRQMQVRMILRTQWEWVEIYPKITSFIQKVYFLLVLYFKKIFLPLALFSLNCSLYLWRQGWYLSPHRNCFIMFLYCQSLYARRVWYHLNIFPLNRQFLEIFSQIALCPIFAVSNLLLLSILSSLFRISFHLSFFSLLPPHTPSCAPHPFGISL